MNRFDRLAASASFAALLVLNTWGQRALTEIPNPDPDYQLNLMKLSEGFEMSLFAAEPMIDKPLAISFDAQGRLYVSTTRTYPHIKPGKFSSDRVYRIEDTDGDGLADKRTIFADGLLIPTAVLATPEGVYVGNSTELLFYEDENDDGVADKKTVVLSGFGTEDTHHIIHTLRAGPAGRIYFNQSVYIHSYVETPRGRQELKAGGVWRLRPETLELDIFSRGLWNSWGHQFDYWGQSFQSDGAGYEGLSYSYPGAIFVQAVGFDRYMRGLNPGQPKFSGLEIVESRQFPDDWQGLLITCDFRGNRISSFKTVDSQSGFISLQQKDLVTSTHGAFRPIDVQHGPDGALYVADWYNPIIQHGEVDFRDERRDNEHGRIWRISAKDRSLIDPPQLLGASVATLLRHLESSESWTRSQTRMILKSRGSEAVLPELQNWIEDLDRSDPQLDHHRLEALWVSQSLERPNVELIDLLMDSEDFRARAAAVRVLEEHPERIEGSIDRLEAAARDEHPRVRLEALHGLRALGGARAAQLALEVYRDGMDEATDIALWKTVKDLEDDWLPVAREDPRLFGVDPQRLIYAIRSLNRTDALMPLETLWREGGLDEESEVDALRLMGELGDVALLGDVFKAAVKRAKMDLPGVAEILDALQESATKRKVLPVVERQEVEALLSDESLDNRVRIARLAGIWKVEASVDLLEAIVANEKSEPSLTDAAVDGLALMQSSNSRKALSRLGANDQPMSVRLRAVAGYARSAPKAAVPMVVSVLEAAEPGDDVRALFRPYLNRSDNAELLTVALAEAELNAQIATESLRLFSSVPFDTDSLQNAVQDAAGIKPVNQALNANEMAAFIEYTLENGNAERGEEVYRRSTLLCMTCHAIAGAGGSLGPDLTSIGASAPMDYIVDSLLQPQKKIKEGYHVISVEKVDGTVIAGRLVSEDERSMELRNMSDQSIVVSKTDVVSRTMSPVSLMPPGLTAPLRKDELADLVLFLSQMGKEGNYKVPQRRFVRTYRYLDDQNQSRAFGDIMRHKPMDHATTDDPRLIWLPTYSKVDGTLPLESIPSLRRAGSLHYHYLRFQIDVKSPGFMGLRFDDPNEIRLWVGSEEIEPIEALTEVPVKNGLRTITLAVSRYNREKSELRIEVVDLPESEAQAQIVSGK